MGARYQLLVLDGAHRGETYPLKGGRFTIGRKEKNDLVLQESTVSGFHLEIAVEGEALILRDLGSTNGTLLDGRRIDEVPLAHGDTFSVGSIRIRLVDSEGGPLAEESQEVQVGRVDQELLQRAGKRRPVLPLVLVLLAVAGAGAWALLTSTGRSIGPRRAAAPLVVPGNLLPAPAASLEGAGVKSWLLDLGTVPFVADGTEAHTGETCLSVELEEGSIAVLALNGPVGVAPGSLLEGALFCKVAEARLALHLVFLEKGTGREVLRFASAWAEEAGRQFQRLAVQGSVPPGCDGALLSVVALGPAGRALVDDCALTLLPQPSAAPEMSVRVPEAPSAAVVRAGACLALVQARGARILSLQPVLLPGRERPRPRDLELARLCFAAAGPDALHLVHPRGGSLEVRASLEVREEALVVSWTATGDPGPGQLLTTWVLPPEVERVEIPARGGQGVGGLKLTTRQDMAAMSWPRPLAYQELAMEGDLRRSLLALGADPLEIQLSFAKDQKRAMELSRQALEASSARRDGEAMRLVRTLLEEVPFDEQSVAQGRELLGRLLEEGQNGLRELRERAQKAFVFGAPADLQAVVAAGTELAGRFAGEEALVAEVETLAQRARALLQEQQAQERARELERLRALQEALGEESPALRSFVEEYIRRNLDPESGGRKSPAESAETEPRK